MRTSVYVVGFNLYYGAVKDTPFKWLNLVDLARLLVPGGHVVGRLKYFTARVSGVSDRRAPARQQAYLNALGTLPEVQIYFGSFLAKTVWRPLTNLPVAGRAIHTSGVVVLPAGDHQVTGSQAAQTLPVGNYPPARTGPTSRCGHFRSP